MGRVILDPKLISKIAARRKKPEKYIKESVSKFARKHGVPAEVALVVLAKQNNLGTAFFQRNLHAAMQAQIRDFHVSITSPVSRLSERPSSKKKLGGVRSPINKKAALKQTIQGLILDPVLLERCQDLLMARSNFDRAINQATQILEDRIRTKAAPPKKLTGESLVGFAFNEDLSKTVLRVESEDPDDQRGFTQILRGVVPAFRNKTHHHITDTLAREDAMRIVGFVDVLLRVVDKSTNTKTPT
jgi:uncharacterized protein (TIGR02391 family)